MSLLRKVESAPDEALWQQLEDATAVMLGVDGPEQFMCPMVPRADRDNNIIWFFTNRDNDRFGGLESGAQGSICLVNEKDHFWACIHGRIARHYDKAVIERFWSPLVEAWYKGGIEDDHILLLAFHPEAAEVSCTTKNVLRFSWEIAKANLRGEVQPDVGLQTRIRLVK